MARLRGSGWALAAIVFVGLGSGASEVWGRKHEPAVRLGLIPTEDARAAVKDSESMVVELERLTGLKVRVFVATDYTGVTEALKFKKIGVAFLGPFGYILARDVANAGVEDFRGKTFSFTDPASTSGNLVPRYMLKKVGIEPERDFKSSFVRSRII